MTSLDLICFLLSILSVVVYAVTKSWIYNNILAVIFCVHAL